MTTLYHPRPERWPQFTLRGLFVVVTLLCVWLGVQVKWIRDRHEALNGKDLIAYSGGKSTPPPAPWSIHILGESGHKILHLVVHRYPPAFDEQRAKSQLQSLFPESEIRFAARTEHGVIDLDSQLLSPAR